MKSELSDGMSNHSDFSNDSQNSQISAADILTSFGNGVVLAPTNRFRDRQLSQNRTSFVSTGANSNKLTQFERVATHTIARRRITSSALSTDTPSFRVYRRTGLYANVSVSALPQLRS
ncbi:unnamed protein product [Callosobruchus maculatus]|uniref:Uncharacterized protein n=1 Tax=Callosobruchus maculatus TaxID=64391 RepID=A0A653C0N3_CALMS|nr:unnamed protein product [Callosobruchus maculatus]